MKQFIEKYGNEIIGTLSGFDRVVFRASPRLLNIFEWDPDREILVAKGMQQYFWHNHIPFKDFGRHVKVVSDRVKEACLKPLQEQRIPVEYIRNSQLDKEERARALAAKYKIESGPVCAFKAMEMCPTFEYMKSKIAYRLRPCQVIYIYIKHPLLGWMHARIQTWFPFHKQVAINGRDWLAMQMDREKLDYLKEQNCFPFIEDFPRAQELMNEQLKTDWPTLLDGFGRQLNPLQEEILERFPTADYWTGYQVEWATDIVFRDPSVLRRLMALEVRHAVESFSCSDVLRFFGRRVNKSGEIPKRFDRDLQSNLKEYREGQRVKFWLEGNSAKFYDKAYTPTGNVFRAAETMTQNVSIFRTYRPKEGGDPEDLQWRQMRKGVADIYRRTEVSQKVNERLINALASVDDSRRLEELIAGIQEPQILKGRRVRALTPFGKDRALLEAVNRGEFLINGIRNRELQAILYDQPAESETEKRARSAAVSRKIRMLRAHGILHKVPKTHRYQIASDARTILVGILTSAKTSLQQINAIRGKAA